MSTRYPCRHFSISLPTDAEDQSLTALFHHVAESLAGDDPISMDDLITIGFEKELGADAVFRGVFTMVFADSPAAELLTDVGAGHEGGAEV
jgi:hypothetical protein